MHRSGTSALTGSLEAAGLHLGAVSQSNLANLKGNRESANIGELNESILNHNGGSWDNVPNHTLWSDAHRDQRNAILAGFPKNKPWGFKDPRVLITLQGWLEAIPNPIYVASIRNPNAVAHSLTKRNSFDHNFGLELWRKYNERLLQIVKSETVLLIDFDKTPSGYLKDIGTIAAKLELDPNKCEAFYSESLRTNKSSDQPLPSDVQKLYETLKGFCI
jgi:hypothetical protein